MNKLGNLSDIIQSNLDRNLKKKDIGYASVLYFEDKKTVRPDGMQYNPVYGGRRDGSEHLTHLPAHLAWGRIYG